MSSLNRGSGADGRAIHTGVLIVINDAKGKTSNYYFKKINYLIRPIIIIIIRLLFQSYDSRRSS
jgi:hypothetical protein